VFLNTVRNGPSRSAKVVDFGTNRKRVCDFLSVQFIKNISIAKIDLYSQRQNCSPLNVLFANTTTQLVAISHIFSDDIRPATRGSERADDPPSVGKRSAFAGERKYSSTQ